MALKTKNPAYFAVLDSREAVARDLGRFSAGTALLLIFATSMVLWAVIAAAVVRVL